MLLFDSMFVAALFAAAVSCYFSLSSHSDKSSPDQPKRVVRGYIQQRDTATGLYSLIPVEDSLVWYANQMIRCMVRKDENNARYFQRKYKELSDAMQYGY